MEFETTLARIVDLSALGEVDSVPAELARLHRLIYGSRRRTELLELVLSLAASHDASEDTRVILFALLGFLDETGRLGDWVERVVAAHSDLSQRSVRVLLLASTMRWDEDVGGPGRGIGDVEKLWRHTVDYLNWWGLYGTAPEREPPRDLVETMFPDRSFGPRVSAMASRGGKIVSQGAVDLLRREFSKNPTYSNPLYSHFYDIDYTTYSRDQVRELAEYYRSLGPDATALYVDTFRALGEEDRLELFQTILRTDIDLNTRAEAIRAVASCEEGREILTQSLREIEEREPRRSMIEAIVLKADEDLVRDFLSPIILDSSLEGDERVFAITRLSFRLPFEDWAIEVLSQASHDIEPRVRISAAEMLSESMGPEARPLIEHLLHDPAEDVRKATERLLDTSRE